MILKMLHCAKYKMYQGSGPGSLTWMTAMSWCMVKVYVGYERYEVGCIHYQYTLPDFCQQVNCLNNATGCVNTLTGAVCQCNPQFYGPLCQWRMSPCHAASCSDV